jgi:hypothetical protein
MPAKEEERHKDWREPVRHKPLSEQIYAARLNWADKDAAHHMLESCKNDTLAELKYQAIKDRNATTLTSAEAWVRAKSPAWREYREAETAARLAKNVAWAFVARLEAMRDERVSADAMERLQTKLAHMET